MAITYTWKLESMKVKDYSSLSNVVIQTYWKKTGVDENGVEAFFMGATPFTPENVDANNFVPYDQLTEETILNWIKSIVVGDYEAHVNGRIEQQIHDKIYITTEKKSKDFPWNKV